MAEFGYLIAATLVVGAIMEIFHNAMARFFNGW